MPAEELAEICLILAQALNADCIRAHDDCEDIVRDYALGQHFLYWLHRK